MASAAANFQSVVEKSNCSSNQRRLEIYLKTPRQAIFADTIQDSF
jgi:hypothetical protein